MLRELSACPIRGSSWLLPSAAWSQGAPLQPAAILFVWDKGGCEALSLRAAIHPKHPCVTAARTTSYCARQIIILTNSSSEGQVLHHLAKILSLVGVGISKALNYSSLINFVVFCTSFIQDLQTPLRG